MNRIPKLTPSGITSWPSQARAAQRRAPTLAARTGHPIRDSDARGVSPLDPRILIPLAFIGLSHASALPGARRRRVKQWRPDMLKLDRRTLVRAGSAAVGAAALAPTARA